MDQPKRTEIFSGEEIEDAIAAGLSAMGLTRDQVTVEVLDEGSRGILGIGSKPARVRLLPIPRPDPTPPPVASVATIEPVAELQPEPPAGEETPDVTAVAREMMAELLKRLGFDAEVEVSQAERAPDEDTAPIILDVYGAGVDELIGRKGDTLAALQEITRLMVGKRLGQRTNLIVDVEGYKQRRERNLRSLARRMAEQAAQTGRRAYLEPMSPYERRIIHLELREHPDVETISVGDGPRRRVTIVPKT